MHGRYKTHTGNRGVFISLFRTEACPERLGGRGCGGRCNKQLSFTTRLTHIPLQLRQITARLPTLEFSDWRIANYKNPLLCKEPEPTGGGTNKMDELSVCACVPASGAFVRCSRIGENIVNGNMLWKQCLSLLAGTECMNLSSAIGVDFPMIVSTYCIHSVYSATFSYFHIIYRFIISLVNCFIWMHACMYYALFLPFGAHTFYISWGSFQFQFRPVIE